MTQPAARLDRVTKRYGDVVALQDVTLTLGSGVTALLGPNGAGNCAIGLAVGYLAGPNSAQPIVNLIYLPLSFASGLWMPLEMLPRVVRTIAPTLPPFHLARLALGTVGLDPSPGSGTPFALGVSALVFLALAAFGFARDEGKTYG